MLPIKLDVAKFAYVCRRFPLAAGWSAIIGALANRFVNIGRQLWNKTPLTLTGAFAIPLLIWLAASIGLGRQDRVVLSIAAIGLAWICLAMLTVSVAAIWIWFRKHKGPANTISLNAGESAFTGFTVSRFPWGIFLQIRIEWINPRGVEISLDPQGGQLLERATAVQRTLVERVVRRIHIGDPFGLVAVCVDLVADQRIVVLPTSGEIARFPTTFFNNPTDVTPHPSGNSEGDLAEFRRYGAGDPLKRIVWKAFARTRQVIVRNPEKANSPTTKRHMYFVAGAGDEATASIARGVLEHQTREDFLFAADGSESPISTVTEGLEYLARSEQFREQGAEGLERFFKIMEPGASCCVLFLPLQAGTWVDRVVDQLYRSSVQCQVIIGTDGITERCPSFASRLVWKCRPVWPDKNHVRQIHDRVAATGASVCVVDRSTGEQLDFG